MPGPLDFFSPGWEDPQTPGPMSQVGAAFADPRLQTALLQGGLNLMAGPTWGDTPTSQIARAVGAGGEALGRQEAEDLKRTEAESKQGLREAQANSATARAEAAAARVGTAGASSELARERLNIARQNMEGRQERARLGAQIRLSGMYQQYIKDLAKRNADPLRTGAPEAPLGMGDWVKQNPALRNLGLVPDEGLPASGEDSDPLPAATPSRPAAAAPKVGEVRKGHRFKGGDPALESSWEKVR